jgi:hypothetical protein
MGCSSTALPQQTTENPDELWRRVPPDKVVYDENLDRFRPSKDSFNNHPNGTPMSAFLASECRDPQLALEGHDGFLLVGFPVQLAVQCGQTIIPAPQPDLPPGHVHVAGAKTDSVRKKMSKGSRWVVGPSEELKAAIRGQG